MTVAHYQTEFDRESKRLGGAAHLEAWKHFAQQGFPTTKHEDWKYTSVAALEKLAPFVGNSPKCIHQSGLLLYQMPTLKPLKNWLKRLVLIIGLLII